MGVSFCDKDPEGRVLAIKKTKEMMDYASHFGAMINVGRLRGEYYPEIPCEHTDQWLVDALQELGEYGEKKRVPIAIETVGKFQTNFINNLEQAVKIIDRVGSSAVKVMMDIFHMQLEESDYIRSIQQYHDRNIHVHLADSDRHYPGHGQLPLMRLSGFSRSWAIRVLLRRKSFSYPTSILLRKVPCGI